MTLITDADFYQTPPASPAAALGIAPDTDLWVFGYGSLMWRPGFAFVEEQPAVLDGYHREFCIASTQCRGTPEQPGLVLGLDRGGQCHGIAFRVAAAEATAVLDYLWQREMTDNVYHAMLLPITLDGRQVKACTFVANPGHDLYHGNLRRDQTAALISSSRGRNGPNVEYLANTVQRLNELRMPDPALRDLLNEVTSIQTKQPLSPGTPTHQPR